MEILLQLCISKKQDKQDKKECSVRCPEKQDLHLRKKGNDYMQWSLQFKNEYVYLIIAI